MNFTVQTLSKIYSEEIWIEISEDDLKIAQPVTQNYSNQTALNQAYINRLCLNVFLQLIKNNLTLEESPKIETDLSSIWEVLDGGAIAIGTKRLVLIPSDAIDTKDFTVPQEWVDIPSLAADYYLPVQVDLENNYLRIWGFVSRQTLKAKADYDPIYRFYYLERDKIIANLDSLWVACQLCADEKGEVAPLPVLLAADIEALIEKLSQPSPYSPRLEIAFEQWGALLNESRWLKQLSKRRQEKANGKAIANLRQWLENKFDEATKAGWLEVSIFGEMVPCMSSPSLNTIKRAKLLNLQLQMRQQAVILLIAVAPEADGKYGVLVQAHPSHGDRYLPANLSLTLLSVAGKELQTSVARERDNFIQLLYFRCQTKTQFSVELCLEGVTVTETFIV